MEVRGPEREGGVGAGEATRPPVPRLIIRLMTRLSMPPRPATEECSRGSTALGVSGVRLRCMAQSHLDRSMSDTRPP